MKTPRIPQVTQVFPAAAGRALIPPSRRAWLPAKNTFTPQDSTLHKSRTREKAERRKEVFNFTAALMIPLLVIAALIYLLVLLTSPQAVIVAILGGIVLFILGILVLCLLAVLLLKFIARPR